jgi:hypothetical protein
VSTGIGEGDPKDSVKTENCSSGRQTDTPRDQGQTAKVNRSIQLGDLATKVENPEVKACVLPMEATSSGVKLENVRVRQSVNEMKSSDLLHVGNEVILVDRVEGSEVVIATDRMEGCEMIWNGSPALTSCKRHLLNHPDTGFQSKRSRILLTV